MSLKFVKYLFITIIIVSIIPSITISQSSSNVGSVVGEPDINVSINNDTITPDERNKLTFKISNKMNIDNNGPNSFETNVSTVKNLSAVLNTESDIEIISSNISRKTIKPNQSVNITTRVWVPEDAKNQNITIDISYNHTDTINYNTTNNNIINSTSDTKNKLKTVGLEVEDIARFEINTENDAVPIGEMGITEVSVSNRGDIDAKNAVLELQSDNTDIMFEGGAKKSININNLDTFEEKEFNLRVQYSESATDKDYSVKGIMRYENKYGDQKTKEIGDIIFNPEHDTEISVENINVNAPIGGSGELEIELENDGEFDIYDAVIKISVDSGTVSLGGQSRSNSISIGSWDEGDDKTISVPISFTKDATRSDYSLSGILTYNNEYGIENKESIDGLSVKPLREQKITSEIKDANVVEGENGNITFEINNKGPKDVENVKLTFKGDENLVFLNNQKNLGELDNEDIKTIKVPIESPTGVDDTEQNVDVTIEYKDSQSGSDYIDEDIFSVEVDERYNQFEISISDNTVEKGSSKNMKINIKNNQSKKITNIEAEFSSSDPISLTQESAYIEELDSGESNVVNMSVSASEGSISNTYPIKIDFEYENADGESKLSTVYSTPVQVKQPTEENSINITTIGLIAVIIVLVMIIIYTQTNIRKKIR